MQTEPGKQHGYSLTVTHKLDAKKRPGKLWVIVCCFCARVLFKLQQSCQVFDLHSLKQFAPLHLRFADEINWFVQQLRIQTVVVHMPFGVMTMQQAQGVT